MADTTNRLNKEEKSYAFHTDVGLRQKQAPREPVTLCHRCKTHPRAAVAAIAILGAVVAISLWQGITRGRMPQAVSTSSGDFLDTFDTIDSNAWTFDIGDGADINLPGWGNNEYQCYTDDSSNAAIVDDPDVKQNKLLQLTARYYNQAVPCKNKVAVASMTQWTSAKLSTMGKKYFMYSTTADNSSCTSVIVESRIKVPIMQGTWAAFWMMPEPYNRSSGCALCGYYGAWPASGEIDIMEHINTKSRVFSTIHFGKYGHQQAGNETELGASINDWHVYAVEWNCAYMKWYVDNRLMFSLDSNQMVGLPFDKPFYIILNLAIGGNLPGFDVAQTSSSMLIDYVKVYHKQ